MTTITNIRLNDLQLVLLSSAAARDTGSFMPTPTSCTQDPVRIGKAVASLLRRALVEELPVTNHSLCWREQDQDMIGLFITDAGRATIGAAPEEEAHDDVAHEGANTDHDVITRSAASSQVTAAPLAQTDADNAMPIRAPDAASAPPAPLPAPAARSL